MELTIIILYLLAIFGVGIYCNKFNKGLDGVVPCIQQKIKFCRRYIEIMFLNCDSVADRKKNQISTYKPGDRIGHAGIVKVWIRPAE